MSASDALQGLRTLFDADPELEIATVARGSGSDDIPDARSLDLGGDAEQYFRGVIQKAVIDKIDGWTIRPLDPVYKPEPTDVEVANADSVAGVAAAIERFANLAPLTSFASGDDDYKKRMRYWVGVLTGANGEKAFFFRAFTSSAELKRKRGAAVVSRDGTFHLVEEEIFLFDDKIDCLVAGGYLFVLRKADYRKIFDQLEEVLRRARGAAQALHARVPIYNIAEFEDACGTQASMADKILAIQKRDYFARLDYTMLQPVIVEFQLGIRVEQVGGQPHLVFKKDVAERFRILKLVDDDYLRSSMTNLKYEVNSKGAAP